MAISTAQPTPRSPTEDLPTTPRSSAPENPEGVGTSDRKSPEPQPGGPVTGIFTRTVHPGDEPLYEQWLGGISRASSTFAGNHGTTILRPAGQREAYIAITHFDTREHLDRWLESAERREWIEKLGSIRLEDQQTLSLAGMERWFELPEHAEQRPPARYKTAAIVLLGLYPVVFLLNELLGPRLEGLPGPVRLLVSLALSVSLMVWVVLPRLTKLFHAWLHPAA